MPIIEEPQAAGVPTFDLRGRCALVTGSTRGLGWAMAQALGAAGATVFINGRSAEAVSACAASLRERRIDAREAAFDVDDTEGMQRALAAIARSADRLDIVISNAGGAVREPVETLTDAAWRFVLDSHLSAAFRLARWAIPLMRKSGYGRIIFTGSVLGAVARPSVAAYATAKGGLAALARAIAVEVAMDKITCNVIAPGYFATDLSAPLAAQPAFSAYLSQRVPMRRWGQPEEIAGAALFLASPASSFVTGITLPVDGGVCASL